MTFKRIVAALDQSPLDQTIYDQAATIAATQNAELLLLNCVSEIEEVQPALETGVGTAWHPTVGTGVYPMVDKNLAVSEERREERYEEAHQWLSQYQQEAEKQGIAVQKDAIPAIGEPGPRICDAAKNWNADLIVVGRMGRTGLAEALVGSVSNHVVHHAPCTVMVVQGETTEEKE
ncbi:universal stress protein [Spirulina sp. CS-785/01]|uniref:universal stress protein n=1 Tax=Spirulina sp. CS-785/01 TaxID=3021716 RepID=UPI00232B55E1|nr:universal stress protein [Spirulina sp. CS-785/01]MDB9315328.1 universal stress protein [Spirulina sp. CS-785/01]